LDKLRELSVVPIKEENEGPHRALHGDGTIEPRSPGHAAQMQDERIQMGRAKEKG